MRNTEIFSRINSENEETYTKDGIEETNIVTNETVVLVGRVKTVKTAETKNNKPMATLIMSGGARQFLIKEDGSIDTIEPERDDEGRIKSVFVDFYNSNQPRGNKAYDDLMKLATPKSEDKQAAVRRGSIVLIKATKQIKTRVSDGSQFVTYMGTKVYISGIAEVQNKIVDNVVKPGSWTLLNSVILREKDGQYFWFYGDDFAACQAPKNNNVIQYELDDSQLYADFKNNDGITVDAGNKTFTLYHMVGAHAPYEMNEQCVDVGETETSLDKQIQGVFRYINEYMRQMKDKGVYDNSTVIITADHGGYGLYERPAVFVKMADTHNDVMQVNSDSVTFKNLYATYGKAALGQKSKFGKTLFDMAGVSQARYHVAPWDVSKGMYPTDEYLKNRDYSVFRIEGDAVNPQISVIKDEQQMKNINN